MSTEKNPGRVGWISNNNNRSEPWTNELGHKSSSLFSKQSLHKNYVSLKWQQVPLLSNFIAKYDLKSRYDKIYSEIQSY